MKRKSLQVRRWLVVGVAAGALGVATSAQARPIIGDGGSPAASVRMQLPAAVGRSNTNLAHDTVTRTAAPDAFEHTVRRGPEAYLGTLSPPVTDSSDSFAWGDFGVGIGAAAGVMLAAVGIALLARNRRRLATLH